MLKHIDTNISESKTEQRLKKMTRLVEISLTLNSTLELEALLQNILDVAAELLECDATSVLLYDERREVLRFVAATGTNKDKLENIPVPLNDSLAGTIFTENRPLMINQMEGNPYHYSHVEKEVEYKVNSLLGVPMRVKNQVIGVLEALNKKEDGFTPFDVKLLLVIAAQAAVAMNNAGLIEALNEANEELNKADELKRAFMAIASHELRTPLGIILGYATFLQEETSGESKQHTEQVLRAAMRLRGVLDDLTNMNLLYAGKSDLNISPTTLREIVGLVKEELAPTAEAKNQKMEFQLPAERIPLQVDGQKIGVVFINVLANAIRFTPAGGNISVKIECDGEVFVSISDNGEGIPPTELEKIFDGFYQVEDHLTRRSGGLGLGLSIAREIVKLHGGHIWAESEGKGHGSTFFFRLPLRVQFS
ncbi:MAG: ATP-binding protein [Chloroflexota bacterium]|nr:ATP-binding protein [Chloroflexota bacterium]